MIQTLDDKLVAMEIEGYCVVEGVIPAAEVGGVRQSIYETLDAAGGSLPGSMLLNHNQAIAPYLAHKRVLEVPEAFWGPFPNTRIGAIGLLRLEPNPDGEPAAPGGYHCDWPYGSNQGSFVAPPKPDVCMNMPCFYMLTDFTRQNGATVVVPGSHRHGDNPNGNPNLRRARLSEVQVTGKAGSVLLLDGRIWHKGGSNYSSERRMFAGVSHVPWWLNCHARRPFSVEHRIWKEAGLIPSGHWPYIRADVYDRLPADVQPLVRHWVDREWVMTQEDSEATIMNTSYLAPMNRMRIACL